MIIVKYNTHDYERTVIVSSNQIDDAIERVKFNDVDCIEIVQTIKCLNDDVVQINEKLITR